MQVELILLVLSLLFFASIFTDKIGYKFGVPALLLFLAVGMLFGPDGIGRLINDNGVGYMLNVGSAQAIGTIALCIILFSGGLDTKLSDIRPVMVPGLTLATIGVLITMLVTGVISYFVFGWLHSVASVSIATALLMASTMSSTDSASVFSILNSSRTGLKQNLKPTLELESGSNDPMAYLLVIILIGMLEGGNAMSAELWTDSAILLVKQLILGAVGGVVIGYATVKIINRLRVDNEFLYPVMVIACVFFTFSLTELIGGNSYLAVYIAGLVVGNCKLALKHTITTFFGGFTWLVQIIMFLSLGLLVNPHEFVNMHIIIPGILLGLFMIIIARPFAVFISLLPFKHFTFKARLYISWVGLRGAVPIIFATYALMSSGVEHARMMFNMVFFITILSLILQGTTVNRMAQWLGLKERLKEKEFKFELPDEITASMQEMEVTARLLSNGEMLKDVTLPPNTLVIMIKRDGKYLVPTGNTHLYLTDKLLLISEEAKHLQSLIESF